MTNNSLFEQNNFKQNNRRPRIVVIGGGYAGMSSVLRLARNSQAEIHLVNPQERFVERIRLHEAASGRNLRTFMIPTLLRGKGVIFHQAWATHIDWRARQVTLSDGTTLGYDRLVYSLGSQIDRTTPGVRDHALALEDLRAATQITASLDALPLASEVLVVGGGLTGTELVFELAERYPHLRWTLVAREAYDRGYAPAAREYFLAGLARRGITLRTGITVQAVEADHLVTQVGNMPFALCLWAGSFRAATLGRESGLAVNEKDQLLVDETMRSLTSPEIFVAGDSAALPASYQPYLVMGCKTAMPMGVHAAENLLGELRGEAPQPLRYTYMVTCVSLGRHDGLIQVLQPDGEPVSKFLSGRSAAWVKEIICRFTVITLQLERHFNFYDWFIPARSQERIQEQRPAHGHGL
ncbi:MAG: FAD-dependent oxidoreductase [Caldilineaceae bacterium]|nr:FAD-dependent oxidoreductase [Caldilineaceae bacterium]